MVLSEHDDTRPDPFVESLPYTEFLSDKAISRFTCSRGAVGEQAARETVNLPLHRLSSVKEAASVVDFFGTFTVALKYREETAMSEEGKSNCSLRNTIGPLLCRIQQQVICGQEIFVWLRGALDPEHLQ